MPYIYRINQEGLDKLEEVESSGGSIESLPTYIFLLFVLNIAEQKEEESGASPNLAWIFTDYLIRHGRAKDRNEAGKKIGRAIRTMNSSGYIDFFLESEEESDIPGAFKDFKDHF